MRSGDEEFEQEPSERYGTPTLVQSGNTFKTEIFPTVDALLYTDLYNKLVAAMAGKGDVLVNPAESLSVVRLVELSVESSRSGKTLDVDI
ncbi:hypothetical protein N7451_009889 [Penicillium sp. IBT 35674x]|nr:hypothetical protein N7451_009889 [Penicillium sp. IBT 35674x]